MADDLLSRALRRIQAPSPISRNSRIETLPGNDKCLLNIGFPGFPGFPGADDEVRNPARFDHAGPVGRADAGGQAGARGHVLPGNPGNPGNGNTGSDIASLSISQKDRETGKSGKSWPPHDLIRPGLDPADVLALFEERAAIREYDGEMTRREAEAAAADDVREAIRDGRIARTPSGYPLLKEVTHMIGIGTKIRVKPDRWHGERLDGKVVDVWSEGLLVVEIEKGRLTCTADDLVVIEDRAEGAPADV